MGQLDGTYVYQQQVNRELSPQFFTHSPFMHFMFRLRSSQFVT